MRRRLTILLACLALSAATLLVGSPARAVTTHTPVIFVHGYLGNASNWLVAEGVFAAGGYRSSEMFTYDYSFIGDNRVNAQGLATEVEQVKQATGASKVDIVNHSMGGLVTLWYLHQLGGADSVRRVASLAGANHGTTWATACLVFLTCQQMYPGSSYIQTVTAGDETPGSTSYATWYSPCDGIIIPYRSTMLTGATNNLMTCETHVGYLADLSVLGQVRSFLTS